MNIRRFIVTASFLIFPLLTFYSCGSDDDSSTTIVQQPEEDGGTTGGTTGGGGGGGCLSTTHRNNIVSFLNKLVSDPSIEGVETSRFRNPEGGFETVVATGSYSVLKESDSSWVISGGFCSETECSDSESKIVFRDGCVFVNDIQAVINSSSTSRVNYTLNETIDGVRTRRNNSASISSGGRVRFSEFSFQNNILISEIRFVENGGGTATGGTATGGTATGGTATGGTATGGTATGGTATGGTATGGTTGGTTTGGTSTGGTTGGTPLI